MENYIKISTLNDFVFCPKSIYFHELYSKYDSKNYHNEAQLRGTLNHEKIDKKDYSTSTKILQGISVYSHKYNLCGKIDLYHKEKKSLMERKTKIDRIYYGYVLQLYAQYFCMTEMGFEVQRLKLYSLSDNKDYEIPIPGTKEILEFERLIDLYKKFDPNAKFFNQNVNKCEKCIYKELCDFNI